MHRGINCRWPDSTAPNIDGRRSAAAFDEIKALGFDFVRLSIDRDRLVGLDFDQRSNRVNRLAKEVRRARQSGLKLVLALAHGEVAERKTVSPNDVLLALAEMLDRVGSNDIALELPN